MNNQEKDKKNLQKDDNTSFYLLSFLFVVCLVALAGVWYYSWRASQRISEERFEPTEAEKEDLRNFYAETEDLINLYKINRRKKISCQRKLDKNFNPKLTSQAKAQIQERLNKLDNYKNPIEFAARLNRIWSLIVSSELVQKQYQKQENFLKNNFPQQEREASEKLNEVLHFFFDRFYQKVSTEASEKDKITWRGFRIKQINEKKDNFSKEDYDTCKNLFLADFGGKFPESPHFEGFGRFLNETDEEKKDKEEGKTTMGLTVPKLAENCYKPFWKGNVGKTELVKYPLGEGREVEWKVPISYEKGNFIYISAISYSISIRLKKEFLFNRENEENEEWIEPKAGKTTYSSLNISWENARETIAHELAHAVIDKMMDNYNDWEKKHTQDGDGKGHGPLHTKYTREIEKMIKNDQKGKEFEAWWKKK